MYGHIKFKSNTKYMIIIDYFYFCFIGTYYPAVISYVTD